MSAVGPPPKFSEERRHVEASGLENFAGLIGVWVEPLADVELVVLGGSGAPGREDLVGGGYGPSVWNWDDFAGACWSAVVI